MKKFIIAVILFGLSVDPVPSWGDTGVYGGFISTSAVQFFAQLPGHYERNDLASVKLPYSTAANRYTLVLPSRLTVNINDQGYYLSTATELDLSVAANWDTITPTDYTVASARAGKDLYVHACTSSSPSPTVLLSANSTYPAGWSATTCRKIGGFHGLSVAVGTISGHTLTGFAAGDILPASVWDLKHKPRGITPEGMVYSSSAAKWVDIYLASGTGASTASVYGGTITDTRTWNDFVDDGGAVGKRLLWDHEFQIACSGSNEQTNIFGSSDPVTTGGHVDTASRRMISNIGLEDCAGVMYQWLLDTSYQYTPDGTVGAASKTATITHVASPGGNPVYVKYLATGEPYLACNMATTTADKWVTLGTDYKILVAHDASASAGTQVYFDEDAAQPSRLVVNTTRGKIAYIPTNNPVYYLALTHSATAATLGVAVNFDDGADQRLEFTSPTATNGTLDLAVNAPVFSWKTIGGNKGQLLTQGTYGDAKLLAGAGWASGSNSGSWARFANYYRWSTFSSIGARFAAEPE